MDSDFVTQAIENDSCLKAHRLVKRFEKELDALVGRMGKEMVAAHPDRFPDDIDRDFEAHWDSGTIIANARSNFGMAVVNKADPSSNMKLNVSVRWVDPLDWSEDDIDGALCAACYKINGGNSDDHRAVADATEESDIDVKFDDDQFDNAPGIFYIPVENAGELEAAADTLIEHFDRFGHHWGVFPDAGDADN
jgi:hypothetical protein